MHSIYTFHETTTKAAVVADQRVKGSKGSGGSRGGNDVGRSDKREADVCERWQ